MMLKPGATKIRAGQTARQQPAGKRWETTMHTALEEVQSKRKPGDREEMIKDLADRKISNTKTSISFGNDKINYMSDAMENQKLILNASHADKAAQAERIRKMKADLTTTNFKLGDQRDKTEYMSTNHQSMLQAVQHPLDAKERQEKAELNRALKEAVKRSSLEFGREPVRYESVMTEEMKRNPGGVVDFQKRKKEIATMKQALSKHNFSFGNTQEFNEKSWETDYASGFGSLPHEAYLHKHLHADEIKAMIAESRSSHYSLGTNTQIHYATATHDSMKKVYESAQGQDTTAMRSAEIERARAMKANLTKTTFVLGDDPEYM